MKTNNKNKAVQNRKTGATKALPDFGFLRVAAAVPKVKIADTTWNAREILAIAEKAAKEGVALTVFPELSITGYSIADLFHQRLLLDKALEALKTVKEGMKKIPGVVVVGLPMVIDNMIFNVGAVISAGRILGIVPKTSIPGYKEFYEERWFSSARDLKSREVLLFGEAVPVGTDLLFRANDKSDCALAVEICEDLWTPLPPSSFHAVAGATVIANLSASNELVGKADYRRSLVANQSARTVSGYIYASSGVHESTTDVVFGGHALIAENGGILAETGRFGRESDLIISEIDVENVILDRVKTTSFGESNRELGNREYRIIPVDLALGLRDGKLRRKVARSPFLAPNKEVRERVTSDIFEIQVAGLGKRLEYSGIKRIVLGLSGGLDSTLALLVAIKTFQKLGLPLTDIKTYTMPGFGTTDRTKSNAWKLAEAAGVSIEEISIAPGSTQQFKDIGHDGATQDITYENVQARYRTMILMNKANQVGGIVLGTGDLSEIALGWCTFSGDHLSHYNVNAGVPKTLVRHVVEFVMEKEPNAALKTTLKDILDTPVSPELKKTGAKLTQKTEDIIGPYELHDFFLYHFVRWAAGPRKILFLASQAFGTSYSKDEVKKWLGIFINRFFKNQWKRSVMPDGPKVGSVALSPRGDWRMPSDAEVTAWIEDLN
ncbi:MAG TPA: NAD(+) synthase [Candidatus Paceibacterota bacterium]|nr:NAD(+) synthase [Candidatus Paceibacterota bacterium]